MLKASLAAAGVLALVATVRWPSPALMPVQSPVASGFLVRRSPGGEGGSRTDAARTPIIVELFTSEGCSDCPPADAVLTRLAATQPVAGAQIIALSEHVDYWDRQGWRDPFSSAAFSARQVEYSRALRVESPYTPQMIVNGRDEFVGSQYDAATDAVRRAVGRAPRQLRVSLTLETRTGRAQPLRVQAESPDPAGFKDAADVFVAVTEDNLRSHVTAGENRGRDLRHSAVVRSLSRIGSVAPKNATWSAKGEVVLDGKWDSAALSVIAFVQDHSDRAILGATSVRVNSR